MVLDLLKGPLNLFKGQDSSESVFFNLINLISYFFQNIVKITEFRVSATNSRSLHILFNPVVAQMFAVCTESGALTNYTIKEQGFEVHSLEGTDRAL